MITAWRSDWRPRLRRGIVVAPADADRWQVRWDFDEITFLEGEACCRVLPWLLPALDENRTLADLEQLARERSAFSEFRTVIECLKQHRFLAVDDGTIADGSDEFAELLGTSASDSNAVRERLHTVQPVVCGRSTVADCLVRSLTATGFDGTTMVSSLEALFELLAVEEQNGSSANRCEPAKGAKHFVLVAEHDWLPQDLDQINGCMLDQVRPWMLVGAWNRRVLVGPIFLPGETACYACYRRRLDSHRRELEAFAALDRWRRTEANPLAPAPVLPAVAELAAAWTAIEVLRYVTGIGSPRTVGRVLVYAPEEVRLNIEPILRVPWCSLCSSIAAAGPG